MHPTVTIQAVLELARSGASASEISRRIAVPRSTIAAWIRGDLPRTARTARAGSTWCEDCGGNDHRLCALPREYVYLLGLYLGDGSIARHRRGVYRLRINLDVAYPGIVEECETAIRVVRPANRVGRLPRGGGFANSRVAGSVEVSCYSRAWPCLIPQHGAGRKHERTIALADWQTELVDRYPDSLLRGLIHSDGCRFINSGTNWRHPRYSFRNVSDDIRSIFCDGCDRLGIRWTQAPGTVYVSRKDDVAHLDRFVGPKR